MNPLNRIKHFALTEIILPMGDRIWNTRTHHFYHLIKEMNTWSSKKVSQWQDEQLKKLIHHHYQNTPFYTRLFDKEGLKPEDIACLEDLQKIPAVNKTIIYKHYNDFIPGNLSEIPYKKGSTGGSVSPLKYFLDLRSWSYVTAMKIYSWETCGYRYGDNYATLGGSSLFSTEKKSWKHNLYHSLKSSLRLSAMNMSEDRILEYIRLIRKHRVKYIYGYTASIYLLAKYLNENNIRLGNIKGCFGTSEVLTDTYRIEIEKAFGYIMDCYGARDGGITAYEIERGTFHVGYNSIAETTNEFETDTGTLLVTDLFNYSFPFIRYELGDEVNLLKDNKGTGYNGQIIKKIYGRTPDIIRLGNGRTLAGVGFYVMFKMFNVSAYKLLKTGNLEITVQLQPNHLYANEEEKEIIDSIQKHAGKDCLIKVEYMTFEEEKNSKRRFIMLD